MTWLDVQDQTSIDAAVAEAIGRFGRIDVLVNNAGFRLFGVPNAATSCSFLWAHCAEQG